MADRHSKLTQAVPSSRTRADHVTSISYKQWIIPYEIPVFLQSGNGPKLVNKFLETLCRFLVLKHLKTAVNQLQSNWQTQKFNRTRRSGLHHYVSEHQWDMDIPVKLTQGYTTEIEGLTTTELFRLVLLE